MDVRKRIWGFVKGFERIYVEELLKVLVKNEGLSNNAWLTVHQNLESRIVSSNLVENYMVDKKLLSFLENNSNLKGKSLTRFLWIYFKKKLNQDLVYFILKELARTYSTIPKISEKEITETNNNVIKLCEKEILNNKKEEISH